MELPKGERERSLLFMALDRGDENFALLLLENGVRYDIVDDQSKTPLIYATERGCMAAV